MSGTDNRHINTFVTKFKREYGEEPELSWEMVEMVKSLGSQIESLEQRIRDLEAKRNK